MSLFYYKSHIPLQSSNLAVSAEITDCYLWWDKVTSKHNILTVQGCWITLAPMIFESYWSCMNHWARIWLLGSLPLNWTMYASHQEHTVVMFHFHFHEGIDLKFLRCRKHCPKFFPQIGLLLKRTGTRSVKNKIIWRKLSTLLYVWELWGTGFCLKCFFMHAQVHIMDESYHIVSS